MYKTVVSYCLIIFLSITAMGCLTTRESSVSVPTCEVCLEVDKDVYAPGDSIEVTIINGSPYPVTFGFNSAYLYEVSGEERVIGYDRYYAGPNPDIYPRPLIGWSLPPGQSASSKWRLDDDLAPGTYLYRTETRAENLPYGSEPIIFISGTKTFEIELK